jgi:hypothetical protein
MGLLTEKRLCTASINFGDFKGFNDGNWSRMKELTEMNLRRFREEYEKKLRKTLVA